MTFSIITPSFNQLDWLRLCVASVRDQVADESRDECPATSAPRPSTPDPRPSSPLRVEHIIQDAGTPGIEDFAREVGADFYRDGTLVFASPMTRDERRETGAINPSPPDSGPSTPDPRPYRIAVHCEADAGMYDAINRGFCRAAGGGFAWLNCDEQYLPGALQRAAREMRRHPRSDYFVFGAVVVDSGFGYRCTRLLPRAAEAQLWSGALGYFSCATFFRRATLSKWRRLFPGSLRAAADVILFLRLARRGRGRWVREVTSVFVDHGENLNLGELAAREVGAIRRRQPRRSKWSLTPATWAYKVKKLLWGSYRPPNVPVEIYTLSSPETRRAVACDRPGWRWSTYRIDA